MAHPVNVRLDSRAMVCIRPAVRALFRLHGVRFCGLVARFVAAKHDVSFITFAAHVAVDFDHCAPPSLATLLAVCAAFFAHAAQHALHLSLP
jgi:hypothetical protein